jgi:hypothetical protein
VSSAFARASKIASLLLAAIPVKLIRGALATLLFEPTLALMA